MTSLLNIDAYPCYWPEGWERTAAHKRTSSNYKMDFGRARDDIVRQLKLMGAREVVISTNVPLRKDGLPLAGMSEPKDPAVAVYWAEVAPWDGAPSKPRYKHRVIACDRWRTVRENIHAVNKSIDALRALKRAGATQVVEKAFTGFTALAADNPKRSWREVFDWDQWGLSLCRENIEQRYRQLAIHCHPDRGGTHEQMAELNIAREQALRETQS